METLALPDLLVTRALVVCLALEAILAPEDLLVHKDPLALMALLVRWELMASKVTRATRERLAQLVAPDQADPEALQVQVDTSVSLESPALKVPVVLRALAEQLAPEAFPAPRAAQGAQVIKVRSINFPFTLGLCSFSKPPVQAFLAKLVPTVQSVLRVLVVSMATPVKLAPSVMMDTLANLVP
jgi:hypothetical protein